MQRPEWKPGDSLLSVRDICVIMGEAAVEVARDTKVYIAGKIGELAAWGDAKAFDRFGGDDD